MIECVKCGSSFEVTEGNAWWDCKGSGYDTKLARCPLCDQINIVDYIDEPDRTGWLYEYGRKRIGRFCN